MKTVTFDQLLREAAELIDKASAIQAKADDEERPITGEEDAEIKSALAEAKAKQDDAERRKSIKVALDGLDEPFTPQGAGYVPLDDPQRHKHPIPAEPRDAEAEARQGWNHMGEFARAVILAAKEPHRADERLMQAAASGMQQAVGSEGGFLVPPAFSTAIWDGLNEADDNLLALTDQYTVEGESLTFPANAETSRAAGSRYGGVRGYWLSEASQITSSKPTLRQVKLEPNELAVLVYVTDKLMRNSPIALNQYVTRAATDEINFLVGDAIINGTGAGQPLGILNSGCLVTVAKETNQAADTFVQANVAKMWARLHAKRRQSAVWLVNQDVDPQIDLMVTQVWNVAQDQYVGGFQAALYDREKETLHGAPIIRTEFNATIGDVGDVILADMKGYVAGVRGGIQSAMSIHLRFDYAESALRFMFEVDGQSWLNSALTPYKGSNTLSTFVALAARA
jgi:HK97 family phage major capsid protein